MNVLLSHTLIFFHHIFWNNCHRGYKFVPVIRCHIQYVVYKFDRQVTKTNSIVQSQNYTLKQERTEGGIFELFMIFWTTFPSLDLSWDLSGYNGRINCRRISCRWTTDSLLGWLLMQITHVDLWGNFNLFCDTKDSCDRFRLSDWVNDAV